jgi:hypothetical protein
MGVPPLLNRTPAKGSAVLPEGGRSEGGDFPLQNFFILFFVFQSFLE